MMRRHVFASALAALVAVASAQDPLYDYSASPLTELTDANFAETVGASRNCAPSAPPSRCRNPLILPPSTHR